MHCSRTAIDFQIFKWLNLQDMRHSYSLAIPGLPGSFSARPKALFINIYYTFDKDT
jgi:hypothetical protein